MDGEETNELIQTENQENQDNLDTPEPELHPVYEMHSRICVLEDKIREMISHMNARLGTKIGG